MIPVITLDGGARTGKGTARQLVAKALGFNELDSGVLYRIVTWLTLKLPESTRDDPAQWVEIASSLGRGKFDLQIAGDDITLDGFDLKEVIRRQEVTDLTPAIAKVKEVRLALRRYQVSQRKAPGLVADGRDMGLIFDTPYRFFLTASDETCARREYAKLGIQDPKEYERILETIRRRNKEDRTREIHPLRPHPRACIIETDNLSREEVAEQIIEIYQS